jgi:hypothetical protein
VRERECVCVRVGWLFAADCVSAAEKTGSREYVLLEQAARTGGGNDGCWLLLELLFLYIQTCMTATDNYTMCPDPERRKCIGDSGSRKCS